MDSPSNAVLSIGTNLPTMLFLRESTPYSYVVGGVHAPNYLSFLKSFFLGSISPKNYPEWTWDGETRVFKKTAKKNLTDALLEKSALVESKRALFETIRYTLNFARTTVANALQFQEVIYLTKKIQAKAFIDSGCNENSIMQYPYVVQYADCAQISLRQAAEDILLKSKLDEELLVKTELLRLIYLDKIKSVSSRDQISAIHEAFVRDTYLNAKI